MEKSCLDFQYSVVLKAMNNNPLMFTQTPVRGRFLDINCGTGIWAIDLANASPDVTVLGVNVARIQPDNHPTNCWFKHVPTIDKTWDVAKGEWNHIHLMKGSESVAYPPEFYRKLRTRLLPGSWFEQLEFDYRPCGNSELEGTALHKWSQHMNKDIHREDTFRVLYDAGFVNIHRHSIPLPLNYRDGDHIYYYLHYFSHLLDSAQLSERHGLERVRMQQLLEEVKSEFKESTIRAYYFLHVYTAQANVS